MRFFRNYFLLICSFISLGLIENEKIYASPSATYKLNMACRDGSDAQFVGKEYGIFGGDPWINYFCIDPTTKSIIKRSYINGKLGEPILLGKLNNPKGGQHVSTYQWVITEYVIENSGVNQILVRYGCFSEDFFNCTSSAQRFVIGRYNQGFTKKFESKIRKKSLLDRSACEVLGIKGEKCKKFESKFRKKSLVDMSMCERLSIKDEKLCKELDKLGY